MDSQAIHTIKSDAIKLVTVKLTCAIDAGEWVTVHRLAERLQELAVCGMHHASKARLAEINNFAINRK